MAVGADLKNTMAVADGKYAWLSQHIGDMDDLATLSAFDAAQRHLQELTAVAPEVLVADAHPLYRSTAWANRNAAGRPVRTVQHHHAHIAAVMAEHGLDGSAEVLGFAFDGTGYGTDGASVGRRGAARQLQGLPTPGATEVRAAGRWRRQRAASVPHGAGASVGGRNRLGARSCRRWPRVLPTNERALAHQLETGFGCAPTSSMGRLFDAVSALAGVRQVVAYEAQAAIELEGLSRGVDCGASAYTFGIDRSDETALIDPAPVLDAVVRDLRAGVTGGRDRRAVPPRGRRPGRRAGH